MTKNQYERFLKIIKSLKNNYEKAKDCKIKIIDKNNNYIDLYLTKKSRIKAILILQLNKLKKINKKLDFDNDCQITITKITNKTPHNCRDKSGQLYKMYKKQGVKNEIK